MAQEDKKNDVRVEDRRYFDKEGNPVRDDLDGLRDTDPSNQRQTSSNVPPPIDFAAMTFMYVQTALIHLGELEDPIQNKAVVNLNAARQMIDILELLREKTKGNLTAQEDQYLEKALFDLRMLYVLKANKS